MEKATRKLSVKRILSLALALLLLVGLLGSAPVEATAETANPFQGTSLSLGSELVVYFYAEVTNTDAATMTFTVNGSEQTVSMTEARHIEGNLYAFPCVLVPAQMTESVTATLFDSGNTHVMESSVRDYANQLLVSKRWDLLTAAPMMLATLHYGAAAQNYFDYNTDNLANAGFAVGELTAVPEAESGNMATGSIPGIAYYGASLVYHSKIAVRFYFTVAEGYSINDFTFSQGETPVLKDGRYYVEIPGVNPQDYADDITLTVSKDDASISVTYSPMDYISRMSAKTEKDSLKTLLQMMYNYHLTAVAYLADPYGNDEDNLVTVQ